MRGIGGVFMKIRVYCELCEKEYELPIGEVWLALLSCPHDVSHHILKEVIDDDGATYECH